MNTAAIAKHLNIASQAIIQVQEWANVFFVKFQGGCRFVSKKIALSVSELGMRQMQSEFQHETEKYGKSLEYAQGFIDGLIAKYGWNWYKSLTLKDCGNGVSVLRYAATNWDVITLHSAFGTPDEMIAAGFHPWSVNSVRGDGYWIR